MEMPDFLRFASDATLLGLTGGAFIALALVALVAERLRDRRKRIDAVGCMPWTAIFLAAAMIGFGLLLIAVKGWLSG